MNRVVGKWNDWVSTFACSGMVLGMKCYPDPSSFFAHAIRQNIRAKSASTDGSFLNANARFFNANTSSANIETLSGHVNAMFGNIDGLSENIFGLLRNIFMLSQNVFAPFGNIFFSIGNVSPSIGNIFALSDNVFTSFVNNSICQLNFWRKTKFRVVNAGSAWIRRAVP
ncbi:MAG: hypothetical protein WDM76_06500 [Limisphaerales bacterium]